MGRNQKKQFNGNNEKIIDYSFDSNQSDFLDIWLSANCDFCISTGTGLDCIPHVYGKKTLFFKLLTSFRNDNLHEVSLSAKKSFGKYRHKIKFR